MIHCDSVEWDLLFGVSDEAHSFVMESAASTAGDYFYCYLFELHLLHVC